jgi:hypothetical protein
VRKTNGKREKHKSNENTERLIPRERERERER